MAKSSKSGEFERFDERPLSSTLPVPGYYIINNQTTGNFVLSFRAIGSGAVIAVDQQDDLHIYNDGTNVRFANLAGRH